MESPLEGTSKSTYELSLLPTVKKTKKKRRPPFTEPENLVLAEGVRDNYDRLLGYLMTHTPYKERCSIWAEITNHINAVGHHHHDVEQVKKRYGDLKGHVKRLIVQEEKCQKTKHGRSEFSHNWTRAELVVRELVSQDVIVGVPGTIKATQVNAEKKRREIQETPSAYSSGLLDPPPPSNSIASEYLASATAPSSICLLTPGSVLIARGSPSYPPQFPPFPSDQAIPPPRHHVEDASFAQAMIEETKPLVDAPTLVEPMLDGPPLRDIKGEYIEVAIDADSVDSEADGEAPQLQIPVPPAGVSLQDEIKCYHQVQCSHMAAQNQQMQETNTLLRAMRQDLQEIKQEMRTFIQLMQQCIQAQDHKIASQPTTGQSIHPGEHVKNEPAPHTSTASSQISTSEAGDSSEETFLQQNHQGQRARGRGRARGGGYRRGRGRGR